MRGEGKRGGRGGMGRHMLKELDSDGNMLIDEDEIADGLAAAGAKVAVLGRNDKRGKARVKAIQDAAQRVRAGERLRVGKLAERTGKTVRIVVFAKGDRAAALNLGLFYLQF